MLTSPLRPVSPRVWQVEAALEACKLRRDARAQELSVERFVALHWALHRLKAAAAGDGAATQLAGGGESGQLAGTEPPADAL
jgi:hypothetical protein